MEKANKGFLKRRELTSREKTLLLLLLAVILVWVAYRFVYVPQQEKLLSLAEEKADYEVKILEINETLRKEKRIDEEWEELNEEKDRIVANYFPKLDQAQIIYMLNSLLEDDNLYVSDLNFNRPNYESIGDFEVKNMAISLPYNGSYDGVVDVINRIKESPRKILVNDMSMDVAEDGILQGNMALKVYSLDGIADSDETVVYIDVADGSLDNPFAIIKSQGGSGSGSSGGDGSGGDGGPTVKPYIETVLHDFEVMNSYFIPSHSNVKGAVSLSNNSKSGKRSLRVEYNVLADQEENLAFIDLSKVNLTLRYPPDSIGMWVYSYNVSPATIGAYFKGQLGEEMYVPFVHGISWTGWKYIELSPPNDVAMYPLNLDKLFIEIPEDRDVAGVVLVDKLEAVYARNIDDDGKDASVVNQYIFHTVVSGENVATISRKYYGNLTFVNEILNLNEMKASDILPVGKVLVLKKR